MNISAAPFPHTFPALQFGNPVLLFLISAIKQLFSVFRVLRLTKKISTLKKVEPSTNHSLKGLTSEANMSGKLDMASCFELPKRT